MVLLNLLLALSLAFAQQTASAGTCWRVTTCAGPLQPSFPGTWEKNNFSPATRRVYPISNQTVGRGTVFDFGQEVGGIVTTQFTSTGSGELYLAFSEAKNWTGRYSDDSNGAFNTDGQGHADGALLVHVEGTNPTQTQTYTVPDAQMRGGFRYLTLYRDEGSNFTLDSIEVSCELSFQPEWPNLRAYGGYFDSSDQLLNKIWYAGAYTLQTNAVPHNTGRVFPIIGSGWSNDADLGLGTSGPTVYVDGSKRDRTVWAGDLAIAVPSILTSLGDISGVRNTLQVMYNDQREDGALPFAGPAINIYNSDTYHLATLIGTYDYFWFSGDLTFLSSVWPKYNLALQYIIGKIDTSGLLFVTGTDDWGRLNQGGYNSEANMLMYHALSTGAKLADAMKDSVLSRNLSTTSNQLKTAINTRLWDSSVGGFKDSEQDARIHPQDANSMALLFSVSNAEYTTPISELLRSNWIAIGSPAPELPRNLIGFGQSFEVKGHFVAQQTARGLDLIRRAWGWYQNHPSGTGSTHIEGYLADGTFGYRDTAGYANDPSYTSHAHGWSTGPVDALTSYVVGLQIASPGGRNWTLSPQFGDLTHAEGGFTTPLGKFSASWSTFPGGYEMHWSYPSDTSGTINLPVESDAATVLVSNSGDGKDSASVDKTAYDVGKRAFVVPWASVGGEGWARVVMGASPELR